MEDIKTRRPKRHWIWTLLVYVAAAALYLLYGNLEISRSVYDGDFKLTTIERLNPVIGDSIGWSALTVCLILIAISLISFKTRWLRWPALGLVIGFVLYPYCALRHTFNNLAPWTTHGEITADDGTTFVFCDSSFLQVQTMAIAQLSSEDNLKTTYRVLVDNNGDSPRSWASVVRPDRSTDEYGQLYLKNGFLIGVRYENKCYLAYDLGERKAYGHGEIETVSPFISLSPVDAPNEIDVQRICDRITEYASFCETSDDIRHAQGFLDGEPFPGCPSTKKLQTAVATNGASVVSVANTMLDCYRRADTRLRSRIGMNVDSEISAEQSVEGESE